MEIQETANRQCQNTLNCQSVIPVLLKSFQEHWDNCFEHSFVLLGHAFPQWVKWGSATMLFMTRSMKFFSSAVFVTSRMLFFLIRRQPSKDILWRSWEASLQLCWNCSVLQIFWGNLVKSYATATLTKFFWCMQSKSSEVPNPVVVSNPLMLLVTKGHRYLNKPGCLGWSFAQVCMIFCYHILLKG